MQDVATKGLVMCRRGGIKLNKKAKYTCKSCSCSKGSPP